MRTSNKTFALSFLAASAAILFVSGGANSGEVNFKRSGVGPAAIAVQNGSGVAVSSFMVSGAFVANEISPSTVFNTLYSRDTLQAGSSFFTSSGTIAGPFYANGIGRVGGVVAKNVSGTTIGATTETSLFTFTLPANALAENRLIRIYLWGTFLTNAVSRNFTWRAKLGSTTMCTSVVSYAKTAVTKRFLTQIVIANGGSTSAQKAHLDFQSVEDANVAPYPATVYGTAAENATTALTVNITMQLSSVTGNTFVNEVAYAVVE